MHRQRYDIHQEPLELLGDRQLPGGRQYRMIYIPNLKNKLPSGRGILRGVFDDQALKVRPIYQRRVNALLYEIIREGKAFSRLFCHCDSFQVG